MKVTLSNRDISNGLVLVQEFLKRGLPVPLSYAMGMTIRNLKSVAEGMAEERQRIVTEHQKTDAEGNRVLTETGDVVVALADPFGFAKEIETLLKQTNDVDVHQISLEKLKELKGRDNKVITPSTEEMEGLILLRIISETNDGEEPLEEPN